MLQGFNITQIGESHIKRNVVCQDYSVFKKVYNDKLDKEFVIALVADGLGSCKCSDIGSKIISEVSSNVIRNRLEKIDLYNDRTIINILIEGFNMAWVGLKYYLLANDDSENKKEYDSTLTLSVYDGNYLYYGHIGDSGIVCLYDDETVEMITTRMKGDTANSVYPFKYKNKWQFSKSKKKVASYCVMSDGVLDSCVDNNNEVYVPFLEPALSVVIEDEKTSEELKEDWYNYLAGNDENDNFRDIVSDDISFVLVENSELVRNIDHIEFDYEAWLKKKQEERDKLDKLLNKEANCTSKEDNEETNEYKPIVDIEKVSIEIRKLASYFLLKGTSL